MKLLGVFGASGFGREVLPLVRAQSEAELRSGAAKLCFVDDGKSGEQNGIPILSFDQFVAMKSTSKAISIAVAASKVRESLAQRCAAENIEFLDVRAGNSVVLDEVEIGEGSVLCPFVCLTANIRIGRHFHANLHSYVGHDCIIGDYVTFAPGVCCNGNVVIEDHAYIGTGAVLKQGEPGRPLVIGSGAVVGMGAIVTKSVNPGVVVVGNPARILERGR